MKTYLIISLGLFIFFNSPAQIVSTYKFSFCEDSVRWITTPIGLKIDGLASFEYQENGKIAVVRYDLNDDGITEYILMYNCTKEGDCDYVVIDGKTLCSIGFVGGAYILISDAKSFGFKSIKTLDYSGCCSYSSKLYEYDGKEYQQAKSYELNTIEKDSLLNVIHNISISK